MEKTNKISGNLDDGQLYGKYQYNGKYHGEPVTRKNNKHGTQNQKKKSHY